MLCHITIIYLQTHHILSFNINPLSLRFVLRTHLTINYYMVSVDMYATACKYMSIVLFLTACEKPGDIRPINDKLTNNDKRRIFDLFDDGNKRR